MATWPTIIDDDGTNTTGTIVNNAGVWTPIKTYIDGQSAGLVITTPFVASDYYGSGSMTWTVSAGNVTSNWAQIVNNLMTWNVALQGTATTGTAANTLNIKIPGGRTGSLPATAFGKIYQATSGWIDCFLLSSGNHVELNRIDSANFTLDANTFVRFQFHIPLF